MSYVLYLKKEKVDPSVSALLKHVILHQSVLEVFAYVK